MMLSPYALVYTLIASDNNRAGQFYAVKLSGPVIEHPLNAELLNFSFFNIFNHFRIQ